MGATGILTDDGEQPDGSFLYSGRILVCAYFSPDTLPKDIESHVVQALRDIGYEAGDIAFEREEEVDWQARFVKSCTTIEVEPHIFIVPSFEIDRFLTTHKDALYIEIDPKTAFGTGYHESTKLALTLLYETVSPIDAALRKNMKALDVGCGSGILSILLAKMGIGTMIASDIDKQAVDCAIENAQKNQVDMTCLLVSEKSRYEPRSFDIVVSNMLSSELKGASRVITDAAALDSTIILSGILVSEIDKVLDLFQGLGLTLVGKRQLGDWCALVLKSEQHAG